MSVCGLEHIFTISGARSSALYGLRLFVWFPRYCPFANKGVSPILSRPLAWFLFPNKAHILSKSPGITVYLSAHHCDIILRKRAEAARVELACELPHDSFPSCFLTIRNTLPNKHSFKQVRATRIELVLPRWQRGAQPLYHTRINYSTTFIRSLKKLQASSSRIVNISSRLFLSIWFPKNWRSLINSVVWIDNFFFRR